MGAGPIAGMIAYVQNEQRRVQAFRQLKLMMRTLRDGSDPFLQDPEYFRRHYRLTPHLALNLVELLDFYIQRQRRSAIPVHLQVLAALRFYSEGCLQKGGSRDFYHPMSQPTFSRCVDHVTNALVAIAPQFITFPNSREQRERVSNGFRRTNRIPNIIDGIDCFKVAFIRPVENEKVFYNYNAGTSMNVQVICDHEYVIRNIRICPGSATDQFVWRFSDVKRHLELLRVDENVREEGNYYLLGDNGYSAFPIILTPIVDAREGSPEGTYTNEHVTTRCIIEQCFGTLTNVWRCISRSRKLHYLPEKVARIITASAVLHNFRLLNGVLHEVPRYVEENLEFNPQDFDYQRGIREESR